MKKQLLAIFGPLILAAVLLGGFFYSPWKFDVSDSKVIAKASTSMANSVLRGTEITSEALSSGKYVPFFGSSELNRVSSTHPSVLAQKYDRNYTPFLLGAAGTQSLSQFSMIHSLAKELSGKKAVFIVSPQWFTPKGVDKDYFKNWFSEEQTYQWLLSLKNISADDQYYAKRLQEFDIVKSNNTLVAALEKIAAGKLPEQSELDYFQLQSNLLSREDELFSGIGLNRNLQKDINQAAKALPEQYDESAIDQVATTEGKNDTSNNDLGIKNSFYSSRLKKDIKKLAGSQKDWDYRYSPEYSDFQLVLNEFAQNNVDVLFIIPPINQKWMDYTRLSNEMLAGFAKKVRYQLTSQGFTNIADLSGDGNEDYFMEDTIHLGWRGWLAADQAIEPFLDKNSTSKLNYQINNDFLSTDWQNQNPDALPGN
ncbi:D-alanyl-lipoteichoic acid biosynthesis protein DltD [Enterococcus sp. HY326]|uniref:D-alanyl-lipoteichoic acid biosynthesis protein DltD n=1 Tax=Enterococcus sp. HY326 TaxID=2971265 RepID=UPI00223F0E10|nr:D-alanyl-lipoteichoic acid biosynthesis protein DltD [Enterococcus sp. HY326]